MKIISWNVNGIRAVERKKSLQELIDRDQPDVLFLQEIKAQRDQLSKYLTENEDYFQHYHSAEKKGYSGTGLWLKKSIFSGEETILRGMPGFDDNEGRVLGFEYKKHVIFGNYFPNGGKNDDAFQGKLVFYDDFHRYINRFRDDKKKVIFTGDLNIAHNEIDLARPKENSKNIGFLPIERAKLDALVNDNWVDVFRTLNPETVSYTWWNMQTRARDRNVGWRIDYFMLDKKLMKKVIAIKHNNDQMGSDHCPLELDIEI